MDIREIETSTGMGVAVNKNSWQVADIALSVSLVVMADLGI